MFFQVYSSGTWSRLTFLTQTQLNKSNQEHVDNKMLRLSQASDVFYKKNELEYPCSGFVLELLVMLDVFGVLFLMWYVCLWIWQF